MDRKIAATCVLYSPLGWVWRLWTEPDCIARWWGPTGFISTVSKIEARPGGVWECVMHGPDGADFQSKFVYSEMVRERRIVCNHVSDPPFKLTVNLEWLGHCKTKLYLRLSFESVPSGPARDMFGSVEAVRQSLIRLRRCAAEFRSTDFTIVRLLDAPRERVFHAWTDAEQLQRWFGPEGFDTKVVLDAARGGALRIDMRSPSGEMYPVKGTPQEIVVPDRLVWWMDFSEHPTKWHESVVAHAGKSRPWRQKPCRQFVAFKDRRGRTLLTVRTRFESSEVRAAMVKVGAFRDWKQRLERLGRLVAISRSRKPRRAPSILS